MNCKYCAKAENRFERTNGAVARIMFDVITPIEWREHQSKDESICIILKSKTVSFKPVWQSISNEDYFTKVYCFQWESLVVKDGVLHREWVSPDLNSKILQIIVPRHKIEEILIESHDSSARGHFGNNKALEKIRKRLYWATCKQDVEHWCKSCKTCIAKKGPSDKGYNAMKIYNTGVPFERI